MNIYENNATQAIVSIYKNEALWKKEILFNFLLDPFNLSFEDILDVTCQDSLKNTIPDFTIKTKKYKIKYEVKISNVCLTESEKDSDFRDAFLVPENYDYMDDIPSDDHYILTWEDLFKLIDDKGATKEFDKLALTREYLLNNSEEAYFKKDISFLNDRIINNESLRSFYRETFNKFFECVKIESDEITVWDDTYYADSSVYSAIKNSDSGEFFSIEYAYLANEDDMNFYCHHEDKNSNIDQWKILNIDFSECENLFARIEYLINKVLIQYKNIFGAKKYKEFFKSKEASLAELYSKMSDLFESTHMSCEFGDRIIVEIIEPIVDELAQKYKLRKDDFYLSSGANSGFYLYKENWDNYRIGFEFENRGYRNLFFGIQIRDGGNSSIKKSTRNKLNTLDIENTRKTTEWWPKREYVNDEYRNWDVSTFQTLLTDISNFKNMVDLGIKKYITVCKTI